MYFWAHTQSANASSSLVLGKSDRQKGKDNEKEREQENKEAVSDQSESAVQNINFKQKRSMFKMFVLGHGVAYQTD